MDFQKRLLQVGGALGRDDTQALVFLCTELLDRDLSSVQSAKDLFSLLMDRGLLSAQQQDLLTDLLSTINRHDLVRKHGLSNQILSTTRSHISPYRKLLYKLSEDINGKDLQDIKFLLMERLPRKKLEESVTTLEVFLEMERKDLFSNTNLDFLEEIITHVCPMLKKTINQIKEQMETYTGPITQETCASPPRSRSVSDLSVPKLTPPPMVPGRPASCEIAALLPPSYFSANVQSSAQSSMNHSNTSLDFPKVSGSTDEALLHGLRGTKGHLSTKTSNAAVSKEKRDVEAVSTSENQMTSKNQSFGQVQTTSTKEEGLRQYPMTSELRGVCLVVNNFDFKDSVKQLNNREGTQIDEECLEGVFKWLGFEMQIKNDCTRDQILSVVQELRSRDHSQMDCLVCCILSHGQEGSVYGVDGQAVQLRQLTEPFTGSQCPSLTGKPKLFFIQACQGTDEQQPVHIQTDGPGPSAVCSDAVIPKDSIPSSADFLMSMATVPHFVSFRDRKLGTWFIQSLCENLVQMVPRGYDLLSILTKVNADVSQKTDSKGQKKQMPQPMFSLRKKVVLPIPEASAPILPNASAAQDP
ncbi:caspase-8 isoform X2 [Centroberyx affinis]|uniref:caspase-8 isoform X2 n=1 Tax=Centroberyx affinis TaxID=166261 RepID=UPI003A5C0972